MKTLFFVVAVLVMLQEFTSTAYAKKSIPVFDDESESVLIDSRSI